MRESHVFKKTEEKFEREKRRTLTKDDMKQTRHYENQTPENICNKLDRIKMTHHRHPEKKQRFQ